MSVASLGRAETSAVARPQWSLSLMLLALHASIAWGIVDWWPRAFLLAHLGLFLLWQPVWRGEREIEASQALCVVAVACLLVGSQSWWLMAIWVAALVGLIGGSVPRIGESRQRMISVLAALYLLSMLLIWVVPQLFTEQVIDPSLEALVRYALPGIPAAMLMIRAPAKQPERPAGVDLFYSLVVFLLVMALVLGSFVVRETSHGNYVIALAQTLVGIAVLLVGLSWLWYPHSGFAGVGYLLSSYVMSLGLPFERWVQRLAELAQEQIEPERFVAEALQHMLQMPWVRAVRWSTPSGGGEFGVRTTHPTELASGDLRLVIYTRWAATPSIMLHLKLLAQMVGHFYEAKQREQAQRQNAYTHAIYETGARLTHDVKNLLQSLKSLCAAATMSTPDQAEALQALFQRQLPQITQRLNITLEKLRAPRDMRTSEVAARLWWTSLVQRYRGRRIEFAVDGDVGGLQVPGELFDNVADNLVENALKKNDAGELRITVTFSGADRGTLVVCDDGAAVPAGVVQRLFQGPVASQTGFGVGLYQSGRLASDLGYFLSLRSNEPGHVCFVLAGAVALSDSVVTRQVA